MLSQQQPVLELENGTSKLLHGGVGPRIQTKPMNPPRCDFLLFLFLQHRAGTSTAHAPAAEGMKICIAIRKRPTNTKEVCIIYYDRVC